MVRSLLPNHVVLSSVLGHDTYSLKPTKAMYGFGGQTETCMCGHVCLQVYGQTCMHACMYVHVHMCEHAHMPSLPYIKVVSKCHCTTSSVNF